MWAPLVDALGTRRALALDLPGHGGSPRRGSYDLGEVAGVVHEAVTAAGLRRPVLVGHSIGGVLATVYAADHPARAVLNVDQPLLAGPFAEVLRSAEPVLRGPDYLEVWTKLIAGMGIEQLDPPLRDLLRSTPRQDLLLGYWREVLEEPAALRGSGTAYHHVSRAPVDPRYEAWSGSGHFPHLAQPEAVVEILSGWE
jgi:pimeloyl-ACP methyl ester carboxylesterase